VPEARFVDLPGAGHHMFITRETEVLRELRAFVAGLPRSVDLPAGGAKLRSNP
jgi:hypothetical protein